MSKQTPKTLLATFLETKAKAYVEPQRKGTPKGEPIGLSRPKYFATVWLLMDKKLKDLAKNLDVSYGLLRKWTTEPSFKNAIANHYEEFAALFIQYINEKRKERSKSSEGKFAKHSVEKFASNPKLLLNAHQEEHQALADLKAYNPKLLNYIIKVLEYHCERAHKAGDPIGVIEYHDMIKHITLNVWPDKWEKYWKAEDQSTAQTVRKIMFERLRTYIVNPSGSDEDKKLMLGFVALLEKSTD